MVIYMEIDSLEDGVFVVEFGKFCDNRDLRILEVWEKEIYDIKVASDFLF